MIMLNMAALCHELRTLPRPGGLLDQDSFFVHVLSEFSAAMSEKRKLDAEQQARAARSGR